MKVLKGLAFIGVLILLWAFGFFWRDLQQGQLPSPRAMAMAFGDNGASNLSPEQLFRKSYSHISQDFYRPLKGLELKYAGMPVDQT